MLDESWGEGYVVIMDKCTHDSKKMILDFSVSYVAFPLFKT